MGLALYIIIITSIVAISYLFYIIATVFHEPVEDENKMLVLDMTGTPHDVAKRYFKTNPYVTIIRSGKKILCRDGGRTRNVCSNIQYLNDKVMNILKELNKEVQEHEKKDSKIIKIETEEEFIHHVLIEIALVLFQLVDLGLDSGTQFCQKKDLSRIGGGPSGGGSSGIVYVTVCNLTAANITKED